MSESLTCSQCGAALPPGGICATCAANFLQGEPTAAPGEPFVPPTVAELAEKFPQLEILELVGKGGMGAVYKARQRELDRVVALKILPPGIDDEPAFAERFAREARALAKLSHPNIVTLFEYGRAENGPYFFLMEFVDGMNLRQLLLAERVQPREALEIVPQICDALQFAHDHGIVHRDIKPENILLDRRGRVKVADFGLAKLVGSGAEPGGGELATSADLTGVGKILGTPSYMAPEQTEQADAVDHRADIYALGVVFYQMLTGELPDKSLQPPSRKVLLDVRLDEIVLRALEKEPSRRYQQASAMKTQVETIAESQVPLSYEPESWLKSRWSAWFGSPIQQEIWQHMSGPEKRETTIRGLMFTMWNLTTWFLPLFIVLLTHNPVRWIYAVLVLGVGLAGLYAWRKILLEGQCSTAWARQRGFTPEQIRKSVNAIAAPLWVRIGGPIALLGSWLILDFIISRAGWPNPIVRSVNLVATLGVSILFGYAIQKARRMKGAATNAAEARNLPPRFSRMAIAGAVWAAFAGAAVVQMLFLGTVSLNDLHPSVGWHLIPSLLLPLGITAPFGTTILGWIAVSQIRRSAGRLHGLGLALFDGLLFPLLALDALIALLIHSFVIGFLGWARSYDAMHNAQLNLVWGAIALTVDFLIVRAVWRAVNKPSPGRANAPSVAVKTPNRIPPLGWKLAALCLFGAMLLEGVINVTVALYGAHKRATTKQAAAQEISSSPASTEPPKLRYLAWQDEVQKNPRWRAWQATGEFVKHEDLDLPRGFTIPSQMDVSKTKAAAENPRFLCLWISHPALDAQSAVEIKLLDDAGKPLETPVSDSATSVSAPSPESQNVGWVTASICAGRMGKIPPMASVRLSYSAGPWQYWDDIAADFDGAMTLSDGVSTSGPAQGADGRAFIQFTRDRTLDLGNEQFDFVAVTKDGRRLNRIGHSDGESGKVKTERCIFDVPLNQVKTFQCRKRPIHTMTWNVPLQTEPPATDAHAATFAPVMERVVKEAADLDTGTLASLPESVTSKDSITENVLDAVAWMEREGMDVGAATRTEFFGVGMRAIAQDKSQWDNLTAPQVAALLDASITQPAAYIALKPLDGTATYVIQTREGGKGILQILGSTDDGVKIRYKLIEAIGRNFHLRGPDAPAPPKP